MNMHAKPEIIPTFDDVTTAHHRITPFIHRTPVLTSRFISELTGAELYFKCENFQKAGAFKVRGASNAVFGLSDEEAKLGVCSLGLGLPIGGMFRSLCDALVCRLIGRSSGNRAFGCKHHSGRFGKHVRDGRG